MARETKVGMLVGLGFIVCFAVILENRGHRDRVGPQMPHEILAQAASQKQPPTPGAAEQRARDYGWPGASASGEASDRPGRASGRRRGSQASSTKSALPRPVSPRTSSSGAARATEHKRPNNRGRTVSAPADTRETTTSHPQRSIKGADLAAATPLESPASLTATAPPAQPTRKPKPGVAQGQAYEVRKGDTLSAIAVRHYGSRSKKVVDAIFNANRSKLSSQDALRVQQVILLPEIEGMSKQVAEPTPKPTVKSKPATAATPTDPPQAQPKFRPYQVKKGDRYATIAKEQLGSAARWTELAELNKDIFPDPAMIRYGVRIRLPLDETDHAMDAGL